MTGLTVREVLSEAGSPVSEEMIATALQQSLRELSSAPGLKVGSAHDVEEFLQHSGLDEQGRAGVEETLRSPEAIADIRARVAVGASAWTAGSWSATETADRLGLSRSGLSRRVTERRVYAVPLGRSHLFPSWQFVETETSPAWRTLPNLVAALPSEDVSPASAAAIMATPQDETGGRSPRAWLAAGGDPAPVKALLDGLAQW